MLHITSKFIYNSHDSITNPNLIRINLNLLYLITLPKLIELHIELIPLNQTQRTTDIQIGD
jgi:hypothetical protein